MSKEQIREFIKEKGLVTADDAIKALKDPLKDAIGLATLNCTEKIR